MREIDYPVLNALSKGEKFVYCFYIYKENTKKFLTSYDNKIATKEALYLPYSGLHIDNFTFNDSSQDSIEINGIFEKEGISEADDLTGYNVKIDIVFLNSILYQNICEYTCTNMIKNTLSFTMVLEPISHKLQKTIVESYSRNCRANLGDSRCLVNKDLYPPNITCDKKFITCCNKFNNAVNFSGEPFIPEIT